MENTNKKKKAKKKWIHPRHSVVRWTLCWPMYLYCKLRYHIDIESPFGKKKEPSLVLFNHQTGFDQFFVSLAFPQHLYYIASEDIFSNSWVSRIISWLVAPIPFRKSTSDLSAVKKCIQIARSGGSIAMAPEGNRTYSGTTEHIKPSVVSLVKALRIPLVLFRIEGGYGAQPRWSNVIRKGKMRCYSSRIIQPEEYAKMSNDELMEIISRELWVDERTDPTEFRSPKLAEHLERAIYYCPKCGFAEFESRGDIITCKSCGRQVRYLPSKKLEGVGFDFEYPYVKEWYDAQSNYVRALDLAPYYSKPVFSETVSFAENIYCKKKVPIDDAATLAIYADRMTVATKEKEYLFPFSEISSATVLGKNKLNIYVGSQIFQFSGGKKKGFNALKYLNIYFHAANVAAGDTENGFLGL